jgi:hypothetical protein
MPSVVYNTLSSSDDSLASSLASSYLNNQSFCPNTNNSPFGNDVVKEKSALKKRFIKLYESLWFISLFLNLAFLLLSTFFYSWYHNWEYSTSFFFASSALTGAMYGIPLENNNERLSITVTMFLYLSGT